MDRTKSRSESLTKRTTDALRQMIVDGALNLGEALSESKVARLLDVSRTPVREAFARLEIEGLVFSEPQRSTRVFLLGPRDVDHICDLRCGLEKMALALAMQDARQELSSRLSEAARRMNQAIESADIPEYLRIDREFHQAVFDCAGNVFLNDAYQTIATKMAALRTRLATRPDYLRKGLGEHWRLCELVRSGDLEGALSVLEEHVSRKEDSFWHLNDGLAEVAEGERSRTTTRTGKPMTAQGRPPPVERPDRILDSSPRTAERRQSLPKTGLSDDIYVDVFPVPRREIAVTKSTRDEYELDDTVHIQKSVDEKRRGRPRVHPDGAARKRAWAARQRAKKKAEGTMSGQAKKRGRPRKYASQAERQKAYARRRQGLPTGV
ncbi:GntR family transcriptional regulator [Xanthobacteraceae bacterium Astr-EGSB]|uniref:GntR family transcriptional regulator n=1 Tax=Astrobacterium formosum TaxID=3069710 RepID=UPI0027B56ACB|nr:GntR family transcriptional regulator [Xanthobacteraceae bacterium Astr-EGSB]